MKVYSHIVLIGRFQPCHNGHEETIRRAAALTDNLIIIIGSCDQPRTYKNPFNFKERTEMISSIVNQYDMNYEINHSVDYIYNNPKWITQIQEIVDGCIDNHIDNNIGIIGHKKDRTSDYLDMFPQWVHIETPLFEPLDATAVREMFFRENLNFNFIRGVVPLSTLSFLQRFHVNERDAFNQIIAERQHVEKYNIPYAPLPHPPIFVTTDAIVIQSGHVLMVKRKALPGKGLWALPGGFVNADTDKSIEAAMLRELREETGIKVPEPVLAGSIVDSKVFDAIGRSSRGRTVTHAFKIVLPDGKLPRVKGMDDAEKAKWVPLSEVKRWECFEDHYDIISWAIGG